MDNQSADIDRDAVLAKEQSPKNSVMKHSPHDSKPVKHPKFANVPDDDDDDDDYDEDKQSGPGSAEKQETRLLLSPGTGGIVDEKLRSASPAPFRPHGAAAGYGDAEIRATPSNLHSGISIYDFFSNLIFIHFYVDNVSLTCSTEHKGKYHCKFGLESS